MPLHLPAALATLIASHKDAGATRKRLVAQTMKHTVRNRTVLDKELARRSQEKPHRGQVSDPDPQIPERHTSSRTPLNTLPIVLVRHVSVAAGMSGGARKKSGRLRNRRKQIPRSRASAPAPESGVRAAGREGGRLSKSRGHRPSKRVLALRGKDGHLNGGREIAPASGALQDG